MPMELLINLLASDISTNDIPWAAVGGFLLGVGGTLSGIAALITARRKGRDEAAATVVSKPDNDGGSGVSDSDRDRSELGGP